MINKKHIKIFVEGFIHGAIEMSILIGLGLFLCAMWDVDIKDIGVLRWMCGWVGGQMIISFYNGYHNERMKDEN